MKCTLPSAVFLAVLACIATPARPAETLSPRFELCAAGPRVTCVVDGDTFWLRGEKIRIADINAPEASQPACEREARLADAATARLLTLLNLGAFGLDPAPDGRDRDRYGRSLRIVSRRGESLGTTLVREGLAEEWKSRRGNWC